MRARALVLSLLMAASAIAAHADADDEGSMFYKLEPGLEVVGSVASTRYCAASEGDKTVSLRIGVTLTVRNVSSGRLIVARKLDDHGALSVEVARDPNTSATGRFEADIANDLEVFPPGQRAPTFDDGTLSDAFVVLEPGRTASLQSFAALPAQLGDSAVAVAGLPPATTYSVRMTFGVWPYRFMAVRDVRSVQKAWRKTGRLIVGAIRTRPFLLNLQEPASPSRCVP